MVEALRCKPGGRRFDYRWVIRILIVVDVIIVVVVIVVLVVTVMLVIVVEIIVVVVVIIVVGNPLLLPTDAHNVKKRRVIKTF